MPSNQGVRYADRVKPTSWCQSLLPSWVRQRDHPGSGMYDLDLKTTGTTVVTKTKGHRHRRRHPRLLVCCGHCADVGVRAHHSVEDVFVCAMRSQQPGFEFVPAFAELEPS